MSCASVQVIAIVAGQTITIWAIASASHVNSAMYLHGQVALTLQFLFPVLNGMDLVKKIEGEGTGSGKPKKQVKIAKSGELPKKQWV